MPVAVPVRVRYRSERVSAASRVFLYGSPAHSDLSWAGTQAGGHSSGPRRRSKWANHRRPRFPK